MRTYTIECEQSITQLLKAVNDAMKAGWEPTGGIVLHVDADGDVCWYYQAMIRHPVQNVSKPEPGADVVLGKTEYERLVRMANVAYEVFTIVDHSIR